MSRPLRSYQSHIISDLQASFRKGNKFALAVLPTGGGKTRIIQDIVSKAEQKGSSVCVIAHRKELVDQIAGAVRQAGIEPRIIAPDGSIRMRTNIASVQTLVRDTSMIEAPVLTGADRREDRERVLGDLAAGRVRVLCSMDPRKGSTYRLSLRPSCRARRSLCRFTFNRSGECSRLKGNDIARSWAVSNQAPGKLGCAA